MKRPIAISLSPNSQADDVILALKTLFNPASYLSRIAVGDLQQKFENLTGVGSKAYGTDSGRTALYLILKSIGLNSGDEVATQAFSCIAVANSINWAGGNVRFVDIGNDFNIDSYDLVKKISSKTRAVILQHTFGIPAQRDKILSAIRQAEKKFKTKIIVIEDCAHFLGGNINGKLLGSISDISFYSFGRDKVISSVFGGMIVTKNKELQKSLDKLTFDLPYPKFFWEVQQLLHPILFYILILPLYNLGFKKYTLGKILLVLLQKLNLLSLPVTNSEKKGIRPVSFGQRMSNSLSILTLHQLNKLEKFNDHRKKIAEFYFRELKNTDFILPPQNSDSIWLRFPVMHKNAKEIFEFAARNKVLLGKWYRGVIQPSEDPEVVGYKMGSCKKAELYSEQILNLPTYPSFTIKDAKNVVELLLKWKDLN